MIALSHFDLIDLLKKAQGLPDEIDIPLEMLESIYPWAQPVPPLEIKIPAWTIILFGCKPVQAEVTKKLQKYEIEIKDKGLSEYPNSLNMHAEWWFGHYVHKKKYAELEYEYPSANRESIKRAVWNFTKLLGINIR